MDRSQILITADFDELKGAYEESENFRIVERDEFKVEDAKEVIKEAYISSSEPKTLLILANKYNIYAQNALLKILEEPPANIRFVLCAKSRSTFLPTILSRLPVKKVQKNKALEYSLEKFDLARLYELAQEAKKFSKSQAKAILKGMLQYGVAKGFEFERRELDYFAKASELIELNSNTANVFITAGLILLRHQKKRRR